MARKATGLTERTEQLRENAVVHHLIDTPRESYPAGEALPSPRRLDTEFAPEQTFCSLPADSSQLSAVMAAVRSKDFVLIGPPGTGKSQTISNLIAQCLAEGKRVLFVSEKIASLDVVYRRPREVNLGEFCLELMIARNQYPRALETRHAVEETVDGFVRHALRIEDVSGDHHQVDVQRGGRLASFSTTLKRASASSAASSGSNCP